WVILSKVSLDFANYIKDTPGIVLTFAPQRPPIDYSLNLQRLIKDSTSQGVSSVLDENYHGKEWEPVLIRQDNVSSFVYTQLQQTDIMIIEGPPGTGKTYLIAELCARLCADGKSVLVTALTNRALMEIAQKPTIETFLKEGKVLKTCITLDEARELHNLKAIKDIAPIPGCLVLSTYYITSAFAADLSVEQPFDYVIMDEASQAVLAMFAVSRKIGKRNLWVGDTHQLSPIVILNEGIIKREGYAPLVNGLQLLSNNSISPIYQLTKTFRFGKRTAQYTGLFYNDSLVATESKEYYDIPSMSKVLCKDGGPTLILTDMPSGDNTPQFAIMMAAFIVTNILNDIENKEIAVLTCMKRTVGALQLAIANMLGTRKNLIVDTVARVQGLTTDITLFFVPDYSYIRTLEQHLFNVATSRAKEHTIIIADRYVLDCPTLSPNVRKYLEKLKEDRCIYVPDPDHGLGKINQSIEYQTSIRNILLP
ncbi:MAG: AAA family ATPase, partial [Bacteroides sp.]|nr:AAA family ATPase [Bacteroides sp.]